MNRTIAGLRLCALVWRCAVLTMMSACWLARGQSALVLDPALTPDVLDSAAVQLMDAVPWDGGDVVVAGRFVYVNGTAREVIVRLNNDGSIDPSLQPVNVDGFITRLARGTGSALFVAGSFSKVGGVARPGLARLTAEGALDASFAPAPPVASGYVQALLPTTDGGVYVVRSLPDGTGQETLRVDRLNNLGAPASGFAPIVLAETFFEDAAVTSENALILISGVNGTNTLAQRVRRYTSGGAIDASFQTPAGLQFLPRRVVAQADGAMLLGGEGGTNVGPGIVRLLANGSRDETYGGNAPFQLFTVMDMALLADGSLVVNSFGLDSDRPPGVMHFSSAGVYDTAFLKQTATEPDRIGLALEALSDGGFVAHGAFGSIGEAPISHLAWFSSTGALRTTVQTRFMETGTISRLVRFGSGNMLAGGAFTQVGEHVHGGIVRFAANDTVNTAFPDTDGSVSDIVIDGLGRAVVLGDFPAVPGTTSAGIFRVGENNQVDATLLAGTSTGIPAFGSGVVLADGSLVVTKHRYSYEYSIPGIIKILPGGGLDAGFQLNTLDSSKGPDGAVTALAVDGSNRILLSGGYSGPMRIQNIERPGIARTDASGVLDATFAPAVGLGLAGDQIVPRADGGFFVIGRRSDAPADSAMTLLRFQANGAIDESFHLQVEAGEYVACYVVTPDNALLVATSDGASVNRVRRFSMSGALDPSFEIDAGVRGPVTCLAFDGQGRLWVGGMFAEINGQRRVGLARFALPDLFVAINGTSQVIVASGAGHELTTTVEGASGVVSYQWYRDGAPLDGATGASLQVSSFDAGKAGSYTVSVTDASRTKTSNPVALVLPVAPVITRAPANITGSVGGSVVLRSSATGLPEPTYQWYRDGALLVGATSSELRLRDLTTSDAGAYTVRVSNSAGSVTSAPAVVAVTTIAVDASFTPTAVSVSSSSWVGLGAGRSDDSLLVTTYVGEALNGVSRAGLYRLRADGSLDEGFGIPGRRFGKVFLVRPDGTAFVAEDVSGLTTYGVRLRRVLPSGQVDEAFGPHFLDLAGARVAVLEDGRVVVAGRFTAVDGVAAPGLVRLHASGERDTGFDPAISGIVLDVAVGPDGTCAVLLEESGGVVLRRLLPSGASDASFPAVRANATNQRAWVDRLADGSYLLLGDFQTVNGLARQKCARILATGVLADDFTSRPGSGDVRERAVLPDGSVRIVTNEGTAYPGRRYGLVVLNAQGMAVLDRIYGVMDPDFSGAESQMAVLPGGAVVFGGRIIEFDGHPVDGFAKVDAGGNFVAGYQARVGNADYVHAACPLDGGRWAIAGRFRQLAGAARPGIGVVGPDGRIDAAFVPEVPEFSMVMRVHRLEGGRLLLVGYFPPFNGGMAELSVIILNSDGSRDRSHDALFPREVTVAAVSPGGLVYLSVPVANAPVQPTILLKRYTADLAEDTSFAPVRIPSGLSVRALSDGRLFAYTENGTITDSAGVTRTGLCRITAAGAIDATFVAPILSNGYNVIPIEAGDGKFIIAGAFTTVNGVGRAAIARLHGDGSLDTSFVPASSGLPENPAISNYVVDERGGVFLFGRYRSAAVLLATDNVLTRLNADGSWDPSVDYVINNFNGNGISTIFPRENGDVLVAGRFAQLGGQPNLSVARITANPFQASAVRLRVAVPEGGSEYLDISLNGAVELPSYRWTKGGQPLAEGDRAVFALRNFTAGDAGVYRAEVTSADGSAVMTDTIEVVLSTSTTTANLTPLEFSETGGLGAIRVSAPAGATWDVAGMPAWVQVASAATTTGSRTISFELDANRTGAERTATVTVAGTAYEIRQRATSGRLANISTRGRVGVGDDVLIVGIVTTGSAPTDFLSRGVGPSLARFGVGSLLPNPAIDLKQGTSTIDENDDWDSGADRDLILSETRRVSAFGLTDRAGDAALLTTLAPGSYTARVFDPAGGQGVALAEFYDRTPATAADPYTRALNISTRGRVGVGGDVLIAGFFISGSVPKQVLIRGVGPGLARFGVADHLVDPYIRVVRSGATVASNDDWAFSVQRDVVEAAARATSAFRLDPLSRDAALVATLAPGSYTVVLSGADGGEGVAIVEVYDME